VHQPLPWLNNYLTDFLFVPVVAHISLSFTRIFIVRNGSYFYPVTYLLFISFYSAVVFEYIMPKIAASYTSDIGDVWAYFLGGIFYYYAHQRKKTLRENG
jgi:hypothetical protein